MGCASSKNTNSIAEKKIIEENFTYYDKPTNYSESIDLLMINAITDLNVEKVKNLTEKYTFTYVKNVHILIFLLKNINENTNNQDFNQIFDILYKHLQYDIENIEIKIPFNICFSNRAKYNKKIEEKYKFNTLINNIGPQTTNFLKILLYIKTNILIEWNRTNIPNYIIFVRNGISYIKSCEKFSTAGYAFYYFNKHKKQFAETHVLPKINHMIEEIEKNILSNIDTIQYLPNAPPKYEETKPIDIPSKEDI